jgi:hypothetical protein
MNETSDPAGPPDGGIMVIRVWTEAGAANGFRARLTFGRPEGEETRSVVSADVDDVVESVREWLSAYAPSPANGAGEPSA